ncbi:hypothetical protein DAI22_04g106700 [Oryza sativa Japonica Group]|jgi:hypothetical protein|nr:hypothetical protein DAI22_04g106700 [Oryza sativa Japonica Group]
MQGVLILLILSRWTAPVHNILSTQSTTQLIIKLKKCSLLFLNKIFTQPESKISKEHWPDINDFFLTNVDYQCNAHA